MILSTLDGSVESKNRHRRSSEHPRNVPGRDLAATGSVYHEPDSWLHGSKCLQSALCGPEGQHVQAEHLERSIGQLEAGTGPLVESPRQVDNDRVGHGRRRFHDRPQIRRCDQGRVLRRRRQQGTEPASCVHKALFT